MEEQMEHLDWETAPGHFKEAHEAAKAELAKLREQHEQVVGKLTSYERRDRFEQVAKEAGIEGITLDDLGDLPADHITPDLLQAKRLEKERREEEQLASVASKLGFSSVDEFKQTVAQRQQQQNVAAQATATQAAVASVASAPPAAGTVSLRELEQKQQTGQISYPQVQQLIEEGRVTDDQGQLVKPRR